ncbi:glutamate ligase domain-containing protein, partial [Vogesella mureinivorans]|uniref:glutamate ligase domain-containing protein n=1 Tax=Vogesella mureinivorans TaxID=657276 RepID=UPI0023EF51D5
LQGGQRIGEVRWNLLGRHNVMNALAALAAVDAYGLDVRPLLPKLADFVSVKRRMQKLGSPQDICIYDDFAHHPTAIRTTLAGLRAQVASARILVAIEPR